MKNFLKVIMLLCLTLTATAVTAQDDKNSTVDLSVYKSLDANEGALSILAEADATIAGLNAALGLRVTDKSPVTTASLAIGKAYDLGKLTVTPSVIGGISWTSDDSTYGYGFDGDVDVPLTDWLSASGKFQWTQNTEAKPTLARFETNYLVGLKIKI
jgi:hypothetical protein